MRFIIYFCLSCWWRRAPFSNGQIRVVTTALTPWIKKQMRGCGKFRLFFVHPTGGLKRTAGAFVTFNFSDLSYSFGP
jgi:hypothetical protein